MTFCTITIPCSRHNTRRLSSEAPNPASARPESDHGGGAKATDPPLPQRLYRNFPAAIPEPETELEQECATEDAIDMMALLAPMDVEGFNQLSTKATKPEELPVHARGRRLNRCVDAPARVVSSAPVIHARTCVRACMHVPRTSQLCTSAVDTRTHTRALPHMVQPPGFMTCCPTLQRVCALPSSLSTPPWNTSTPATSAGMAVAPPEGTSAPRHR